MKAHYIKEKFPIQSKMISGHIEETRLAEFYPDSRSRFNNDEYDTF